MFPSYQDLIKDTSAAIAKLRGEIPDTMRGFSAMAQGASKPGVLDAKTKELIATALSVAARCDPAWATTPRRWSSSAARARSWPKRWPWPSTWAAAPR